jgi:hypothetical protein
MVPKGIGVDVYAHCLKYHTTTNMSAEEVHAAGLAEVHVPCMKRRCTQHHPVLARSHCNHAAIIYPPPPFI